MIQKERRDEKATVTNGGSIPAISDSPVAAASSQGPPSASPEVVKPNTRPPPHHQFRRPADVFDSKLYQPTKLSEKVFIPVKDYPKVGSFDCVYMYVYAVYSTCYICV